MVLTGILYFKKIYGRKKNKLLYQCIPYSKEFTSSPFLIPYKETKLNTTFSKVKEPIYILFRKDTETLGTIIETIGPISNPENYYQYELYSNNLIGSTLSFKYFPKETKLNTTFPTPTPTPLIFTIDPEGCKDYDDAISMKEHIEKGETEITIYISNVPFFLEKSDLWKYITERVSTIYLPHQNIPLLPNFLSENYCSLQEGKIRYSFNIHFFIKNGQIVKKELSISTIYITKNYRYEEDDLLSFDIYQKLLKITNSIKPIKDSHELISFWMIETNFYLSTRLQNGFLRKTEKIEDSYYEYKGMYINIEENEKRHDMLNLETYTHGTSPIRRIIDLLNLCFLQNDLKYYSFRKETMDFCRKWKDKINFINKSVTAIKRVQNRCLWIHRLHSNSYQEEKGIFIEKNENEYLIFFKSSFLFKKYKSCYTFPIGEEYIFKFYYFPLEGEWNKKIRIEPTISVKEIELS